MRIISGKFAGRVFRPARSSKWPTRPTTDIAKEALFNILQNRLDFEDLKMLDLFGGVGNHTLEAFSRGSRDITYVERYRDCITFVNSCLSALDTSAIDSVMIKALDVYKFVKNCDQQFDYIFADPPYADARLSKIPDLIFEQNLLFENGLLVVEHDSKNSFLDHHRFQEQRKYGISHFSFFK